MNMDGNGCIMAQTYTIRKATILDVKHIYTLLRDYAEQGVLLGRSLSDLYDQIRDFSVAVDEASGRMLGICGLHICWEGFAEIRSLAVTAECKKQGIGRALVEACQDEAIRLGSTRLFVLTYVPEFFKKLGFDTVDKAILPHKVWRDCINCVKFPDCDEESLIKTL
jgi:amino-acid N-acetyltransferase